MFICAKQIRFRKGVKKKYRCRQRNQQNWSICRRAAEWNRKRGINPHPSSRNALEKETIIQIEAFYHGFVCPKKDLRCIVLHRITNSISKFRRSKYNERSRLCLNLSIGDMDFTKIIFEYAHSSSSEHNEIRDSYCVMIFYYNLYLLRNTTYTPNLKE